MLNTSCVLDGFVVEENQSVFFLTMTRLPFHYSKLKTLVSVPC